MGWLARPVAGHAWRPGWVLWQLNTVCTLSTYQCAHCLHRRSQEALMSHFYPPVVASEQWRSELASLREREKAATKELDAIAAQRRRLPVVRLPEYTLQGADGPVSLADVFDGKSQLITYHHMWFPGQEWQCGGCTFFS